MPQCYTPPQKHEAWIGFSIRICSVTSVSVVKWYHLCLLHRRSWVPAPHCPFYILLIFFCHWIQRIQWKHLEKTPMFSLCLSVSRGGRGGILLIGPWSLVPGISRGWGTSVSGPRCPPGGWDMPVGGAPLAFLFPTASVRGTPFPGQDSTWSTW